MNQAAPSHPDPGDARAPARMPSLDYIQTLRASGSGDVPASLLRRTAALVVDMVVVAGLARHRPELAGLSVCAPQGASSTLLVGLPGTSRDVAALINGTVAVWNELDEGLRGAGHPGAHIVPAAVAVAEAERRTAPELLIALGNKVHVTEDRKPTACWPRRMPASGRLTVEDGTVLAGEFDDPVDPSSDDAYVDAVRRKSAELAAPPLFLTT